MTPNPASGKHTTTASDYHALARLRLDPDALAHFDGAAGEGRTARANLDAFERVALRQQVLGGVSEADTSVTVLGTTLPNPVGVAPIGSYARVSEDACRQVAAAAEQAGSLLFASQASRLGPAAWRRHGGGAMVMMCYPGWGNDTLDELVAEAEFVGFSGVGVTVDSVVPQQIGSVAPPSGDGSARRGHATSRRDLERLRARTPLPLVVKGVMSVEDAAVAADCGADAVVVSNHGGRMLDGGQSSLELLAPVVDAVGDRVEVIFDGGIRRGSDVAVALALGARMVLAGRPVCWALSGGADGVASLLEHLRGDTARTMCLMGAPTVDRLERSMLAPVMGSPVPTGAWPEGVEPG